jgi:hypothetical protein
VITFDALIRQRTPSSFAHGGKGSKTPFFAAQPQPPRYFGTFSFTII